LGSRLLVLKVLTVLTPHEGTIGYRLVGREPGPVVRDLPDAAVAPDPLLAAAVKIAVGSSGATSAHAARDALADQGVGFVALGGAATEPLVGRLDATAGMARLGESHGLILWRVLPNDGAVSPSRLRLEDAQGVPVQSIAVTGDHGRTNVRVDAATVARQLVVAEPAGWAHHARVMFGGRELAVIGGGEQPAYVLPHGAGQLTITLGPTRQWWHRGQLGLLLVVLFLAAPFGSLRSRRMS
jgi:hypothetical protein